MIEENIYENIEFIGKIQIAGDKKTLYLTIPRNSIDFYDLKEKEKVKVILQRIKKGEKKNVK